MSERDRAFMRGQLASIGIFLPDKADLESAPITPRPSPDGDTVDRDFVREALVRAGAPEKDLEWLVASCRSELDALGYRAPLPMAWCVVHDRPQPTNEFGCVLCRSTDIEVAFVRES